MQKLKLTKSWISPKGRLKPGEYAIPDRIALAHAKCAVADGAGEIVNSKEEVSRDEPAAGNARKRPSRPKKIPAPENKIMPVASENKADLDEPAGDSGSDWPLADDRDGGEMPRDRDDSD